MITFLLLILFAVQLRVTYGQAIDSDKVDFTTIGIYKDLRQCMKSELLSLPGYVQCSTNACMCRASTQGEAIAAIAKRVSTNCQNLDDISTATSIVSSYCAGKGYTSIISATILTGASTVTIKTTVTDKVGPYATVTVYTTRYLASAPQLVAPVYRFIDLKVVLTIALTTLPSIVLCYAAILMCVNSRRNIDKGYSAIATNSHVKHIDARANDSNSHFENAISKH